MSSLEEKSSIFKKTTSDFLLNKNGLLECPLFENIINAQTKIWFMRIYEGFMAISKVGNHFFFLIKHKKH